MHAASLGLTDVAIMILERLSTLHRMIYLGNIVIKISDHTL